MNEIYHEIVTANNVIIFDVLNGELFSVPPDTAHILTKHYNNGIYVDAICSDLSLDEHYVRQVIDEYKVTLSYATKHKETKGQKAFGWSVTLHVSHKCNLACSYCLVDSDYGNPIHMTPEILEASLNYLTSKITNIDTITFYGGEPTLNFVAIKRTVQYFKECLEEKTISNLPHFSLITNGTKIDETLADFIVENQISVGVSIDGTQAIHDKNRCTVRGENTHHIVMRSIKLLKERNGDVSYTAVYTPDHLKQKITVDRILEFMSEEAGLEVGSISPALNVFSWEEVLDYQTQEMINYLEDHLCGTPLDKVWLNISLNRLLTGDRIESVCPGGLQNFAIDPEGKIFPCQGFAGKEEYQIGSVFDITPFPTTERYKRTMYKLQKVASMTWNHKCSLCWVRNLCNFCPLISETYFNSLQPPDEYCKKRRESMEKVFGKLGDIFSNKDSKKIFLKNFHKRLSSSLESPRKVSIADMP